MTEVRKGEENVNVSKTEWHYCTAANSLLNPYWEVIEKKKRIEVVPHSLVI